MGIDLGNILLKPQQKAIAAPSVPLALPGVENQPTPGQLALPPPMQINQAPLQENLVTINQNQLAQILPPIQKEHLPNNQLIPMESNIETVADLHTKVSGTRPPPPNRTKFFHFYICFH